MTGDCLTLYELESLVSFLLDDGSYVPTFPQPTFYNFYRYGESLFLVIQHIWS